MRWFKHIGTRDKLYSSLSWADKGMLAEVLEACQFDNDYNLTTYWLTKLLHIHRQKAERLLPIFQQILLNFCQNLDENCEKLDENFQNLNNNCQKLDKKEASNPRGSTRDREIERLEEREENRLEGNQEKTTAAKNKRGVRLPPDWQPSDVLADWAKTARPDLVVAESVDRFRDYWIAKPGEAGVKLDWDATFRNWIRNERGQNLGQTQSRASHERLHGSDIVPAEQRQGGILTLWQ